MSSLSKFHTTEYQRGPVPSIGPMKRIASAAVDILDQIILCCRGLSYTLEDF